MHPRPTLTDPRGYPATSPMLAVSAQPRVRVAASALALARELKAELAQHRLQLAEIAATATALAARLDELIERATEDIWS